MQFNGGLGIRSLRSINEASLLKLGWDMLSCSELQLTRQAWHGMAWQQCDEVAHPNIIRQA